MLIKITEINAWERERWSHILDLSRQSAEALNYLFSFIRLANQMYDEAADYAQDKGHKGMFAASKYIFTFHDCMEIRDDGSAVLISGKERLITRKGGGYKGNCWDLNMVISPRKMLSARNNARDKNQNILYKNFESSFFKTSAAKV